MAEVPCGGGRDFVQAGGFEKAKDAAREIAQTAEGRVEKEGQLLYPSPGPSATLSLWERELWMQSSANGEGVVKRRVGVPHLRHSSIRQKLPERAAPDAARRYSCREESLVLLKDRRTLGLKNFVVRCN